MESEDDFKRFAKDLQDQLVNDPYMGQLVKTLDDAIRSPGAGTDQTNAIDFSLGAGGFGLLTAYTFRLLYCWANDWRTHHSALQNVDIAKQQIRLIDDLVAGGWDREAAAKVVASQLAILSKRTSDDSAIKQILALVTERKR